MWIVKLALRQPVTLGVMAALMLLLGLVSLNRMNFDIFPAVDIPVVDVVWSFPGLSAQDMETRVIFLTERATSSVVNGIEHIESLSINGAGVLKYYFQPGVDTAKAISELAAECDEIRPSMPPGINQPTILDYNATNVPVLFVMFSSRTMTQSQVFDFGYNYARMFLFTIPGLSAPAPFGGAFPQVMVNIDPAQLYSYGLSPNDVVTAIQQQNVITPAGTAKIGNLEYDVLLNGSPRQYKSLEDVPIKVVNGAPVYIKDVARVSLSHEVQHEMVRVNGNLGTYLLILKHPAGSTIQVVSDVKAALPRMKVIAPKGVNISAAFDQSVFVRHALIDVLQESLIAAALVAVMVLLFLGSWRSTLIVIVSIPLAVFSAVIGLKLSGQTINLMTLGGLALAVGMLVDDATVEVENIHRNHATGKPLGVAILDGARQIALPTLVGTLAICIVFSPVLGLGGIPHALFTPLAMAVVYAMLASYLLSRTLVPSMALHLLPERADDHHGSGWGGRFTRAFERGFERVREAYRVLLIKTIARRWLVLVNVAVVVAASLVLVKVVGEDFFPPVDTGMIRLHVRAPVGTRLEQTARIVDAIEADIRRVIPAKELMMVTDHIGLPASWMLPYYQTDTVGPQDADLQIQLAEEHHPTDRYVQQIRRVTRRDFPNVIVYSQAADVISQVLSFGLSAPIDVQMVSRNVANNFRLAEELKRQIETIPGAVDVRIQQVRNYPALRVRVDRVKALEAGITERDISNSLLASLSSSVLTAPNQWLDLRTGVNYAVVVQTPQRLVDSIQAIGATPLTGTDGASLSGTAGASPQFLANLAEISHDTQQQAINHYTLQRVVDVNLNVEGRDLGSVSDAVQRKIAGLHAVPRDMTIRVLGESARMRESFSGIEDGLLLAVLLAYLLMATNFQSWLDPMIIMVAVPGALAGVLWMLLATHTTLNVESMMGAIMAVGVGVANGNLLITFANDLRGEGYDATAAAIEAAVVRMRPVIMTALAMILGMLPMSLAMGAGGEQNAPLARAVIGGLIAATFMTLFVVPAVYSLFAHPRLSKRERAAQIEALAAQAEQD